MSYSTFTNSNISLDSPTFLNRITTPIVYGGVGLTATLTLNGTSNVVVSGSTILLQPSGGKVGIGTTTPAYNLDVSGTSRLNNPVFTTKITTPMVVGGTGAASILTLNGTSSGTTTGSYVLLQPTGGNVGIGMNGSSTSKLYVEAGTIATAIATRVQNSNYALQMINSSCSDKTWGIYPVGTAFAIREAGVADQLTILAGGNVGIGTNSNSPLASLHVFGHASSTPLIYFGDNSGSGGYGHIGWDTGGFTTTWIGSTYSDLRALFQIRLRGLSSASAVATFVGNGTACKADNTTVWQQSSDIRIKENVTTISNAINIINSLRPITYDYNQEYAKKKDWDEDKRNSNYGFIGQEYELVLPKYVTKSIEEINGENVNDFRNINTDPIVPLLVKAMQEQQILIEENKKQIHALCLELNYMRNYNKE